MKPFMEKKKHHIPNTQNNSLNNSPQSPRSPARDLFDNLSPWNDSGDGKEDKFSCKNELKENIPPQTSNPKKFTIIRSIKPNKPPLHPKSLRFNSNTPKRSRNNSKASKSP
jgi:hypothetical protein